MHSWEENWDILSTYFDYPVEIRKIIYTTNAIEGLNRQFRKVTKTKNVFPNDDSLRKMLYLAIQNLSSRWTQRCRNWDLIINQLKDKIRGLSIGADDYMTKPFSVSELLARVEALCRRVGRSAGAEAGEQAPASLVC